MKPALILGLSCVTLAALLVFTGKESPAQPPNPTILSASPLSGPCPPRRFNVATGSTSIKFCDPFANAWTSIASGSGSTVGVFASVFIATSQANASICGGSFGAYTTFADLTTPDTITYSLGSISNVIIQYSSQWAAAGGPFTLAHQAVIDTVADSHQQAQSFGSGFVGNGNFQWRIASQAAGSHTVDIQHCSTGNTLTASNRLLEILVSN